MMDIQYRAHVQGIGWQNWVQNGEVAGTTGQSLRMEAIQIKLNNVPSTVGVRYRAHVQGIGWQNWVQNGEVAGTTGQSLRMEAIQIELTGVDSTNPVNVKYAAHIQSLGWQSFVGQGAVAGTTGQSRALEALKISLAQSVYDLDGGDLGIIFVSTFEQVWNDKGSGGKFDGAYYKPIVPDKTYRLLGYYGQSNYNSPNGVVIAVKELKSGALAKPVDYQLVWEDRGSGASMDGAFWLPIPPKGYVALGMVVVGSYGVKPSTDEVVCVRQDLVVKGKPGRQVWIDAGTGAKTDFGSWEIDANLAPDDEKFFYVRTGTFFGITSHNPPADHPVMYCLKVPSNKKCLLDLKYVYEFEKIWDDSGSGAIFDGSVYRPIAPQGYSILGHLAVGSKGFPSADEINTRAVLVARGLQDGILKPPVDFELIGTDRGSGAKLDCSWWKPIPLPGYAALGTVFAPNYNKPPLNSIMCVRLDQLSAAFGGKMLYADRGSGASDDVSVFEIRPNGKGLNVGATVAIPYYIRGTSAKYNSDELYTLSCPNTTPVLTRKDIEDIIARRGPILHFHPQEPFFTMTVDKFLTDAGKFEQGSKKYLAIRDGKIQMGDLANSTAYVFVEQVHPQFTDIQFWFFYGHNGKTYIRIEAWASNKISSSLNTNVFDKDIDQANNGEHVGDWEHITLRVSNTTKDVVAVGYSSHGDLVWYKPNSTGNINVYSALNMHGCYPQPKTYLELASWQNRNIEIGALEVKVFSRNICADSSKKFEAYKNYQIVKSDTLEIKPVCWLTEYAEFDWGPSAEQVDKVSIYEITNYEYKDTVGGPSTPSFKYE